MNTYTAEIAADGHAFPEGPRWHEGRLWFTDQHALTVHALDAEGRLETLAETTDLPGGLCWLPDGTTLVVYMTERRLMRLVGRKLDEYANLSAHASFHCNDVVADTVGRVYAGNFGFDLHGGAEVSDAEIVMVDIDGAVSIFARDVVFPNGSVITPDGTTMLVAETFAQRISAFEFDADGRMRARSVWAELGDATPDGICLDAEGAVWVASPGTNELFRVLQGGEVVARCETTGTPYACMLGGDDRRRLYICTSETDDPTDAVRLRTGRIEQVKVGVGGAGLP